MAALFRRLVGRPRPMTEDQAYMAFVQHQRECGVCGAPAINGRGRTDRRCQMGVQLVTQWQQAVAAQNADTQPIRRRETAGRR